MNIQIFDINILPGRGQYLGFRGEALHALCTSADVTLSTKSDKEPRATKYQLNHEGVIVSQSQATLNRGTIITAEKLFASHPVRRQFFQNDKTRSKEITDIQDFLKSLAIAIPKCHLDFFHNNNRVWNKASVNSHQQALIPVLGSAISKQMVKIGPINITSDSLSPDENRGIKTVEMYMPKKPVDMRTMSFTSNKMTMIFCNQKRVYVRQYEKLIHRYVVAFVEKSLPSDQRRFPISVVLITVPPQDVDFNRDVDKSKVHLVDKDAIYDTIERELVKFYGVLKDKDSDAPSEISDDGNINKESRPVVVIPGPVGALPPVPAKTPVETRQNAVATFLQDIPVSSAFSLSPTKPPGVEPTVVKFPASKPCVDKQAIAELSVTSGDKSRPSPLGGKHVVSNFSIFLDSQEDSQEDIPVPAQATSITGEEQKDTSTSNDATKKGLEIKLSNWLEGRMQDKNGQPLQNVEIVTKPPESGQSDAKRAYERFREALFANRRGGGGGKSPYSSTPRESIIAGPPQKRAKSDDNSTVESPAPSTSRHRQVTLESLANWSTPSTVFSQAASTSVAGISRLPLTPDAQQYFAELDASARAARAQVVTPMEPPPPAPPTPGPQSFPNPPLAAMQWMEEQATIRRTREQFMIPSIQQSQDSNGFGLSTANKPVIIGRLGNSSTGPLYTMKVDECVGVFSPKNMAHYFPDSNVGGRLDNSYMNENQISLMFQKFLATREINESLVAEKIFHVMASTASLAMVYSSMKSHRSK